MPCSGVVSGLDDMAVPGPEPMITPPRPTDDAARQAAVERYRILGTRPESRYDGITALLSHLSGAPTTLIALLDGERNWFKSRHGFALAESPRDLSFCGHTLAADEGLLVVEDAREDPRFADNPFAAEHRIVFYAGVALRTPDGYRIGTLCLFDYRARTLDAPTRRALVELGRQVEMLLEARVRTAQLEAMRHDLERRNEALERFAVAVAHDLKSPIAGVGMLADALAVEAHDAMSAEARQCVAALEQAAASIAAYIDDLLALHRGDGIVGDARERVELSEVIERVASMAGHGAAVELGWPEDLPAIETSRAVLLQVLLNLVTNAIKYNDAEEVRVGIGYEERDGHHAFNVTDNGRGIAPERLGAVFESLAAGEAPDRDGRHGTGLGLDAVKRLVEGLGGEVGVESAVGAGTTFWFTLPKGEERGLARAA